MVAQLWGSRGVGLRQGARPSIPWEDPSFATDSEHRNPCTNGRMMQTGSWQAILGGSSNESGAVMGKWPR